MKNYLAIYLCSAAAMAKWNEMPEQLRSERRALGVQAWHDWVDRNKDRIVELGTPLGKTKAVGHSGISDVRNAMTAYTVVRADSHEEAAGFFVGHPHYTIFPGESIEVMECLPIPDNSGRG